MNPGPNTGGGGGRGVGGGVEQTLDSTVCSCKNTHGEQRQELRKQPDGLRVLSEAREGIKRP